MERLSEALSVLDIRYPPRVPCTSRSQILRRLLGDDRTNLFVARLQGVANRNLLYLCNLWLNPLRFLDYVFSFFTNQAPLRLVPESLWNASLLVETGVSWLVPHRLRFRVPGLGLEANSRSRS